MPVSEAQYKAQKKYDAANTRQYRLKLNLSHDADIIKWLDEQVSKQGAIKALIRKQIERERNEK